MLVYMAGVLAPAVQAGGTREQWIDEGPAGARGPR